jgi:hypothetical protein
MKRLWLSITITVAVVAITATGITLWVMVSNVDEKVEMFVDRLSDNISDNEKVEEIKQQMDSYYSTLPGWLKDRFNSYMEEYVHSSPTGKKLEKVKSVDEIIEGIETYRKEKISIQKLPAFIAELENLVVVLPTEAGKSATGNDDKIKEVIKEFNDDLGTESDEKEFIEKLGKLIDALKSEGANEAAKDQKDDITSFLNGLAYGDLTEEEEAIFNQKLGEYVQGIKAGKQDEVKMEGNFAQIVEFYNNLTPENQKVFVEVVEEYIK